MLASNAPRRATLGRILTLWFAHQVKNKKVSCAMNPAAQVRAAPITFAGVLVQRVQNSVAFYACNLAKLAPPIFPVLVKTSSPQP